MKVSEINDFIEGMGELDGDRNLISDGYHTFGELYEARCLLFVALAQASTDMAWRARRNADGQRWEGWFLCGIQPKAGHQITFHLPEKFWSNLDGIETHDINPYFDGHTSHDVLERLLNLINQGKK